MDEEKRHEQIRAARNILAAEPTGQMLTEGQVAQLKAEAEKFHRAQSQVAEALGVLWTAQLDVSLTMGDADSIRRVLSRPQSFYDNCNCGGPTTSSCW